jgi:hypothetical protein
MGRTIEPDLDGGGLLIPAISFRDMSQSLRQRYFAATNFDSGAN